MEKGHVSEYSVACMVVNYIVVVDMKSLVAPVQGDSGSPRPGFVDFQFGYSRYSVVCPVLVGQMGIW